MRFRWVGLLVAIAAVVGLIFKFRPAAPPPPPPPATQVAVTKPSSKPAPVVDTTPRRLFDVLKLDKPEVVATTQPLGIPLDLNDAARFVLDRPVYLDDGADLWITHPDGVPVGEEIRRMERRFYEGDGSHVVREVVRYIYWMSDNGKITPAVFVETAASPTTGPTTTREAASGGIEVVTSKARLKLPQQRAFAFGRALPQRETLAIPVDNGISVLTITPTSISESFVELPASKDPVNAPQVVIANKGLLAWSPASSAKPGSNTFRYLDGQWTKLDEADWPTSIIQLSPFLDGTVQQIRQGEPGKIELASVLLDATKIDEKMVLALIDKLGDLSQSVRDKAFRDLQRIGPAAWPIAKSAYDNQLPEVQQRLDSLLASKERPAIGTMTPVDGKMIVVDRFANAGILLYGASGVQIPDPGKDEPALIAPAWVCIRPDAGPELLSERLVKDIRPGSADLIPVANEWILFDGIHGPRRFIGNAFQPLLHKSEYAFCLPIGADRRGRTLYRQSGKLTPTLIIDPTLPDPTPRLPVWTIRVKGGTVGWTGENYPAIKKGGAWELHEDGYRSVDEAKTQYITKLPDNWAATQPSDPALGRLLLTDRDGVKYYDGKESLTIVTPATTQPSTRPTTQPAVVWPLPTNATGKDPVALFQAPNGKLFLFNQPGRVLRLSKTGDAANPFKLEATFSRNIPSIDEPTRLWIDPVGRICMAYDAYIAVMFTEGRIPREITNRMSVEELEANQPE